MTVLICSYIVGGGLESVECFNCNKIEKRADLRCKNTKELRIPIYPIICVEKASPRG